MIAQLTRNERQLAILISLVVAIVGLMLGIAGRDDPLGLQGLLIFLAGLMMIALIGRHYLAPEPSDERLSQYYDDPTRAGIVLAMIWVVFGLAIGDWSPGSWSSLI
jgi:cytochrome c oxidase cbb3-type subunit I